MKKSKNKRKSNQLFLLKSPFLDFYTANRCAGGNGKN